MASAMDEAMANVGVGVVCRLGFRARGDGHSGASAWPPPTHFKQASAANQLVIERRIDPCMSEVFPWAEIPDAHVKMRRNEHKPGNMAVLVSAPRTGLRTFADAIEASRGA